MEAPPKKKKILWKDGVALPWAHLYGWEGGGLWPKHLGLKPGAIGNTLGEHIGNLDNILGGDTPPPKGLKFGENKMIDGVKMVSNMF
jgi:hypothetical protein